MSCKLEINGESMDYGVERSIQWLYIFDNNKWSLGDLRRELDELNELNELNKLPNSTPDETLPLAIHCINQIIANHFTIERNPYRGGDLEMLTDAQKDDVMKHMNIDDEDDDAVPFSYLCDLDTNNACPTYWADQWQIACMIGNVRVPVGQTKDDQTWISHQKNLSEKLKPRVVETLVEMADKCDDVINSQTILIDYC